MRIIAGEWRGRPIAAPKGSDTTRPTSDRVREALFSILTPWLRGARVLDLFAGSGALALEALSRGAEFAVLCDCDRNACKALRSNIDTLSARERTRLMEADALRALDKLSDDGEAFDLIFLDPPYQSGLLPRVLERIARGGLLREDGRIIAETSSSAPAEAVRGLTVADTRKYGAAVLVMLEKEKDG